MKLLTIIFSLNFVAANADDGRDFFKNLIMEISAKSQPLKCEEWSYQTPTQKMWFKLSTEPEPNYQDAYFVRFTGKLDPNSDKVDHDFSTLVAYMGLNNYVMGRLKSWDDGNSRIFEHTFHGFFDDVLRITLDHGKMAELSYRKINPQGVEFYRLTCP